jgi:hypothetical protein
MLSKDGMSGFVNITPSSIQEGESSTPGSLHRLIPHIRHRHHHVDLEWGCSLNIIGWRLVSFCMDVSQCQQRLPYPLPTIHSSNKCNQQAPSCSIHRFNPHIRHRHRHRYRHNKAHLPIPHHQISDSLRLSQMLRYHRI